MEQKISVLKRSASKYNPRKITKQELERLKKAYDEYGDLGGIILNKRTGKLVGGHQRVKVISKDAVIEKAELSEISRTGTVAQGFIVIDGENYSYREVDWDENREKAANIAANAHGGDWDEIKLAENLKGLSALPDFDFDLTGFDLADIFQTLGEDPSAISAEKLLQLSEDLRKNREVFKEVQKKMEETDDVLHCYLVVVFRSYADRKEFTDALELEDNRYVDGRGLQKLLTSLVPGKGK